MKKNRYNLAGIGGLMMGSGMCALMYKAVWLRELKLTFGGSTAASAATLAIFMGGLGLGSMCLGKIADRHRRPLSLYANLEFAISSFALVTPLLLSLVRQFYFYLGGASSLGAAPATVIRLLLAAAVLIVPTFLMGGTLPAAVMAVEVEQDQYRRRLAVLYGLNTIGAVAGISLATFVFLNILDTQKTLWVSCLLNILVALMARSMARAPADSATEVAAYSKEQNDRRADNSGSHATRSIPHGFIYGAALVVGFTFFLMELVWYRMLGPLLGGSTYTLGLILAVALLGIGVGGGLYAFSRQAFKPTLGLFTVTCGFEALCIAVPYALGDQLAILAALLQPLDGIGMYGKIAAWTMVAGLVILPAAVVSGFQFPLLIGLLGRGRANVGKHTGQAYAWNTVGAILGSLVGGFGLLPLFSATGLWQAGVVLLVVLELAIALLAIALDGSRASVFIAVLIAIAATGLLFSDGPTAAWRHSPIGAGRVDLVGKSKNEIIDWAHARRRSVIWEKDGKESSIGIDNSNGLSFFVNGKSDGNARLDGATQVMLGLLGALLHPEPRNAMVVGLGTGSSAGWLARVDSVENVDVVEIEPAIEEVARRCKAVNEDILANPKVNITYADAREFLMTTGNRYDIIASEPSNPYRAGVASLYTREFYLALAERLSDGGIFSQWVQAYEVDALTIKTIMATLASVFKSVEIWRTNKNDMLLVCSKEEKSYDVKQLRRRITREPFRSALVSVWGVVDLEGFLARFVAGRALSAAVAEEMYAKGMINSDDRMLIEFDFARTVGKANLFTLDEIYRLAWAKHIARPDLIGNTVDWERVQRNYALMFTMDNYQCPGDAFDNKALRKHVQVYNLFVDGNLQGVYQLWNEQRWLPDYPLEMSIISMAMADAGDADTLSLVKRLSTFKPIEAMAIKSRYYYKHDQFAQSGDALVSLFEGLQKNPWMHVNIVRQALDLAADVARRQAELAPRLYKALAQPFAVDFMNEYRLTKLLEIASLISWEHGVAVVKKSEPHIPWREDYLRYRRESYKHTGDLLSERADLELSRFLSNSEAKFGQGIPWEERPGQTERVHARRKP